MSNKLFWATLGVLAIIFVGALSISKDEDTSVDDAANPSSMSALFLTEAVNSEVVLTEYSDFQCPACAIMHPLITRARDEFKDEVTFQFRHFPLVNIHPNTMTAHRIAQAADSQGVFAEVHDLLFENNNWSSSSQPGQAIYSLISSSGIAIDAELLKRDAENHQTLALINQDLKIGMQAGVEGTPSLFINDKPIEIRSYDELRVQLENAIRDKQNQDQSE